jgi:hypothetical protein
VPRHGARLVETFYPAAYELTFPELNDNILLPCGVSHTREKATVIQLMECQVSIARM